MSYEPTVMRRALARLERRREERERRRYDLEREPLLLEEAITYRGFAKWAQIPARNLDVLEALVGGLAPTDPGTREVAAGMLCRLMENICLIWN